MIFVRELASERAPTALAVAHHMAKKTNKAHTVRFDRDSQRWFIHPRWQDEIKRVEDKAYVTLGELYYIVLPTDVKPKWVVPELG
jgi:hypothetical protein